MKVRTRWFVYFLQVMTPCQENKQPNSWLRSAVVVTFREYIKSKKCQAMKTPIIGPCQSCNPLSMQQRLSRQLMERSAATREIKVSAADCAATHVLN